MKTPHFEDPQPIHRLSFWHPVSLLATWFGAGRCPKIPGTAGTLAALPFAWGISLAFGLQALLAASLALFLVGVVVSDKYMEANGTHHDPGEIVIDEVAAIWLLLVALPQTFTGYLFGFLVFRFFDMYKPWPISILDDTVPGGFGVMLDDYAAAIYPGILIGFFAMFCAITGLPWLEQLYTFLGGW